MKPILYLRTSTKDQDPELQREQGVQFCIKLGLEEPEVYSEQGSAYKIEKVRPVWESVVELAKKQNRDIVIWKYDRCFRNQEEFYKFMKIMFEVYETKVYSVTEPTVLSFWELMDKFKPTGNPVFDELLKGIFRVLWDFMIRMVGDQAEEESKKKSERVKLAVRKKDGITKSYKGNKWGRRGISTQAKKKILELRKEGKSIQYISKNVTYTDKNNKPKNVSVGIVHKLLKESELNL